MALNLKMKKESVLLKKEQLKKMSFKLVLIIVGILLGVGGTFLYIQKYGIPFKTFAESVSKVEEDKLLQETVAKVGKLIILPADEVPVMATIIDADSLAKNEPFYSNAKNGDIVLMYQKALKAIIYSPEKDIIVNVGPVYVPPADSEGENPVVEDEDTSSTSE